MPWGAVVGAVATAGANKLLSSDENGGAGTTSKEPWAEAAPWLKSNITLGQNLQDKYTAQPFSAGQQTAYGNQYALNDFIRQAAPGMFAQMGQPQGFNRDNPSARPAPFSWGGFGGGSAAPAGGMPNMGQQSMTQAMQAAPVAPMQAAPAAGAARVPTEYETWNYGGLTAEEWAALNDPSRAYGHFAGGGA